MKKLVLVIVGLLGVAIGFALCYYINKPASENQFADGKSSTTTTSSATSFKFGEGSLGRTHSVTSSIINRDTAINHIKDFQTINRVLGSVGGYAGTSGLFNGFYIDATSLRTILGDKNLSGISFYIGKHPNYPGISNRVISIFFVGATSISGDGKPPYRNSADVYEYVDPCPPACGDLVP